ncbi:retrovirus-related pol polyprotein from transposon TNT 1-94 [Tanacetum coccineum]|uniref:Retrovirus-related pol polyprotein from transposon TNT 1-94 n=1 Tax=Tanacetum coccineum TaxID=301880 RepID=A0ABQ4YQ54_9ASTR
MSMQPILYFKDYPKISTTSSITTLKQNQFGTTSKALAGSELTKEDRESQLYDEFERFKMLLGQGKSVKCYNYNGIGHIARNCTQPKRPQNSDYFKDKMLLMQAQENGAVLDEEELLFLAGEQADECDAFDSDVDDEPTAQSIFMANLSSAGSANPQAGPSNASILSEVHILENAIDHSVTNQDEHEIHNEVQQANVIDSTSVDMGNSNVIPYEQYMLVDNISVVPSCASFALNDPKNAQPALYDGEELLKTNHVPVIVPSSEEELELAETSRNKLHAKMNDSACVEKRVLKMTQFPITLALVPSVTPPKSGRSGKGKRKEEDP